MPPSGLKRINSSLRKEIFLDDEDPLSEEKSESLESHLTTKIDEEEKFFIEKYLFFNPEDKESEYI
ncbi:hypothetical protein OEK97_28445, partial [Escherichia coli]|uniref:hypothetical protein n=1 Tax=Escherichia coli TaxID=562 RepID=UPI0021D83349